MHNPDHLFILFEQTEYYKHAMHVCTGAAQRNMYYDIIEKNIAKMSTLLESITTFTPCSARPEGAKTFTLEELAKYNGSGGNPAYVAVNGIVYDVSTTPSWGGGTHFGVFAGKDVTESFKSCHNIQSILKKLPKVGILQ